MHPAIHLRRRARAAAKWILARLLEPLPRPKRAGRGPAELALHWRLGWIRGIAYRAWFALAANFGGTRVVCGRRLSVEGRFRVRGPGTVILGEEVVIGAHTDIYTHSREAVVQVGDGCFLNGTRFGCQQRITIGSDTLISDARIMDTDFHPICRERNAPGAPVAVASVRIGCNVWVAAGAAVLKGVTVGDNAVIGFGAVVSHDVRPDRIAAGNPCKEVGTVPSLLEVAGKKAQPKGPPPIAA